MYSKVGYVWDGLNEKYIINTSTKYNKIGRLCLNVGMLTVVRIFNITIPNTLHDRKYKWLWSCKKKLSHAEEHRKYRVNEEDTDSSMEGRQRERDADIWKYKVIHMLRAVSYTHLDVYKRQS